MPFTTEERRRIWEVLKERGVANRCTACGKDTLSVLDYLALTPVQEKAEFALWSSPAGVLPCVVLVCGNCGYTLLFNLKVLGLLEERMVSDVGKLTEEVEVSKR